MASQGDRLPLKRYGSMLISLGILVFPSGLLLSIEHRLPFAATAFLGAFLIASGKRLQAKARASEASLDSRKPILYLRPFSQDEGVYPRWLSAFGNYGVAEGQEQTLARIMSQVGPFLAIGRPGEKLPPLGAIRKYVNEEEWQQIVGEVVRDAALVILRIGSSQGLVWEFRHVCGAIETKKLVLYHPILSFWPWRIRKWEDDYAAFRSKVQGELPFRLPRELGACEIVTFTDGWEGRCHQAQAKGLWGYLRGGLGGSHLMHLREGLRPAFDALDIPLPTVPLNSIEYAVLVLWVLVLLVVPFLLMA